WASTSHGSLSFRHCGGGPASALEPAVPVLPELPPVLPPVLLVPSPDPALPLVPPLPLLPLTPLLPALAPPLLAVVSPAYVRSAPPQLACARIDRPRAHTICATTRLFIRFSSPEWGKF